MKLTYTTLGIALLLSIAGLLGEQTAAVAGQESLTQAQVNQFSRDLLPNTPSQDFFRQGRQRIEREILLLNQRQKAASTEPILKIDVEIQTEIDRLPQLKPSDLQQARPNTQQESL
jgi:hypothetical protein